MSDAEEISIEVLDIHINKAVKLHRNCDGTDFLLSSRRSELLQALHVVQTLACLHNKSAELCHILAAHHGLKKKCTDVAQALSQTLSGYEDRGAQHRVKYALKELAARCIEPDGVLDHLMTVKNGIRGLAKAWIERQRGQKEQKNDAVDIVSLPPITDGIIQSSEQVIQGKVENGRIRRAVFSEAILARLPKQPSQAWVLVHFHINGDIELLKLQPSATSSQPLANPKRASRIAINDRVGPAHTSSRFRIKNNHSGKQDR